MEPQQFSELMVVLKDIKHGIKKKEIAPIFNVANLTIAQQAQAAIALFNTSSCRLRDLSHVGGCASHSIMTRLDELAQQTTVR